MTESDFTTENVTSNVHSRVHKVIGLVTIVTCVILIVIYGLYQHSIQPPTDFPIQQSFTVTEGSSVASITQQLERDNIIRSAHLLYFVFLTKYDAANLKAGTYNLTSPLTVHEVAALLAQGDFTADLLRLTHVEGDSVSKLANRLSEILPDFDIDTFIAEATPYEGTLFPDTYLVPPRISVSDIISLMRSRYEDATIDLATDIEQHPLAEEEIVILASIIEREANSLESMRLVSGILQNRLRINMPLQVDASMEYVLDKPLQELVPADLEVDSPYNTYRNNGLPPTAIGNPGINSIKAVLEPTASEYLYYITGRDGQFYYAQTFDEHRANIARHLR